MTIDSNYPSKRKSAFIYLDEAGDFNFSASGSKYFMMTCMVVQNPIIIASDLLTLKYQCIGNGMVNPKRSEKFHRFHASDDFQVTRDKVFIILKSHLGTYQTYTVVIQKNKVNPSFRDNHRLFPEAFAMLMDQVLGHSSIVKNSDYLAVITDAIPVHKKKGIVRSSLKSYLKQWTVGENKRYCLYHHLSASDLNLQAADYLSWAIFRKWERSDARSYGLISASILGENDLLKNETKTYYDY